MKIFKAACFCVEICGPSGVVMFTCSFSLLQPTWCAAPVLAQASRWSTRLCWLSRLKLSDSASNTWRTKTTGWRYKFSDDSLQPEGSRMLNCADADAVWFYSRCVCCCSGYRLFFFSRQAEKMRAQLAALPPLHVTKLPSRDGGRPEVLSSALYRKTDQLLETLLQMSANVKVVDITGKSPGTRKT